MLAMACSFARLLREASSLARKGFAEIAQHLARAVVPRGAGHPASRMGPCAAKVESLDRAAVVGEAEQRPRRPELVEAERAVEDVAGGQAELRFQVRRG